MIVIKVAIMGAGLSGLSCAIELEKHGIKPDIYESRSQVGDRFVNGELFFEILNRPINDSISYLAETYELSLKPLNVINKLIVFSPHNQAQIRGQLGYISIRGRHEESLEKQLGRQVTSEIIFNSKADYPHLVKEYSHVVLATGDGAYSQKLHNYHLDLTVSLRGATIEGKFEPTTVMSWLNNDFAPKGYAYLIPFSDREANIVIAYPNYEDYDVDQLWDRYLQVVQRDIGQSFRITDTFAIANYIMGFAAKGRVGDTFYTGNCLGTMMPFMGFGQFPSILSGIYAALDICGVANYEEKLIKIRESYRYSLVLRRFIESMSNENLDTFVKILDTPLGQSAFSWQWLNLLKIAGIILSPWSNMNRKMRS